VTPKTQLQRLRERARSGAALVLSARGFERTDENGSVWQGALKVGELILERVRVELPPQFPDALPKIFVEIGELPKRLPHVEHTGRVCIAGPNVLLNAQQPRQLVVESIERARRTLHEGLLTDSADEICKEFLGYWTPQENHSVYSLCDPSAAMREIVVYSGSTPALQSKLLLADSDKDAGDAIVRLGGRGRRTGRGIFVPLDTPMIPLPPETRLCVENLFEIVQKAGGDLALEGFKTQLRGGKLPCWVVFSSPVPSSPDRVLWGVLLEPRGIAKVMGSGHGGFRRANGYKQLQKMRRAEGIHINVLRLDEDYIVARAGGDRSLFEAHVLIVGMGAVGGHLSLHLSRLGVGKLTLVDFDNFLNDNLCRHVLDASNLGQSKVDAVRAAILRSNPARLVDARPCAFEKLIEQDELPDDIDLVILATGDHTLELRAAELFLTGTPVMHVWLEPFGIGGHALLRTSLDHKGCLGCLYPADEFQDLQNQASFLAAGQEVEAAVGGCAGTFTPFLGLAADRAAIEAAGIARRAFVGGLPDNALVSWFTPELSLRDNLALSPRGKGTAPGARIEAALQPNPACRICTNV
jgi:molybdopterin/thiamine biosynthesis adenylyltransferase